MLWHALEHVSCPGELLNEISRSDAINETKRVTIENNNHIILVNLILFCLLKLILKNL